MPIKLNTASGGGVILTGANTATDKTITVPAVDATMLTDSSGVLNIGSGQVYKDASGNVGIGTTSPASRMHLSGSDSTGPAQLKITNTTAAATRNIGVSNSNNLVFERAGVATDVVIDSNGNLLVGTTTSRSSYITTVCDSTYNGVTVTADVTSARTACSFRNPNGAVGSITTSGTATAYNTSSDYRLKENVQPMTGALAKISALKPCTYLWKTDGSDGEGFIAHELAEVVPGCVTGEKDAVDADGNPVYQGIDTSFLVATLAAAIQEQQQMIKTLQAKVAALEAK